MPIKIPDGYTTICMVARFKPQKNHRMFFEVAKHLLNVHNNLIFICVGDYAENHREYYEDLMKWFSIMGIEDNVMFLGKRADVFEILSQIDISVLTSNHEGLSNTLIESMMAGCSIIVTDVSDHRKILEDGVNGFIVQTNDVKSMSEKLDLLIRNPSLRKIMGENNVCKWKELFSIERMVRETEYVFDEMIKKKVSSHKPMVGLKIKS